MENLTFDLEELYQAVRERALSEGAFEPEEWNDTIDMVLGEREGAAEIHDEEDLSAVKEQLRSRYDEFKTDLPEA